MPSPDTYRPWRHAGASLGIIRRGIYWIQRSVHGRRYRISTGCRTAEAALAEYKRWEISPSTYVPRGATGSAWDDAAIAFTKYSEHVRLNSSRHVDKQEAHLANFGAWTRGGVRVFGSLEGFTATDIRDFIGALTQGHVTERQVGAPTVNRHLASLKAFMSWARQERLTSNHADTEVPMLREDKGKTLPKEIPALRWRAILAKLDSRWRAAAEVQLGCGLRYGEVARLEMGHVHAHAIHVAKAKGRHARTVPASKRAVQAARRLVALGGVPDDEAGQFDHRLRVACKGAKVARVTSHQFRHTYGCVTLRALLRAGLGLPELQARMGHASIRTTEIYLRAVKASGGAKQVVGAPL
ncbi:MAG: hypothetical protein RJA59_1224 [Pseudomonadota bacterium]